MFGVEWNNLKLAKQNWQEKKNTEAIIPKTWQKKKKAEAILSGDQSTWHNQQASTTFEEFK